MREEALRFIVVVIFCLLLLSFIWFMVMSIPENKDRFKEPSKYEYACVETTYKLNKEEIFVVCGLVTKKENVVGTSESK